MTGGNVAYHLRPNKYVERHLFAELLAKLCLNEPMNYTYISMGGAYLEDHRLIHQTLGLKSLFSFEADQEIHKRQLFNQRPFCIKCIQKPISDFVDNLDGFLQSENIANQKIVVWLDYASPQKRREQLVEYATLLSKLQVNDIVKITINANPKTLGEQRQVGEKEDDFRERQLRVLKEQIGDYLSPDITRNDMVKSRFASALTHTIRVATERGLKFSPSIKPLLLALFSYQDSEHQMLTATIKLTTETDDKKIQDSISWDYFPSSWTDVKTINVPALSAKERLEIESKLPSDDIEALHNQLPFKLHTNPAISLQMLNEYATHYKRYPSYFQVVL